MADIWLRVRVPDAELVHRVISNEGSHCEILELDCCKPLTPEARAVLDAACGAADKLVSQGDGWPNTREGRVLVATVRAYRASLKPAPRYYVDEYSVRDREAVVAVQTLPDPALSRHRVVCNSSNKADAEKIAEALNRSDAK